MNTYCRHLYLLITLAIITGCKEKPTSITSMPKTGDHYKDSTISDVMEKFGLAYAERSNGPDSSMIFYGTRPFDTSFLVRLTTKSSEIMGVYYEVLPIYHNKINDVSVDGSHLLFFDGYTFKLDLAKWGQIKKLAEQLLSMDSSFRNNDDCQDCEYYVLSYNSKSIRSNIGNRSKYELFYDTLNDLFLKSFIQRRKPIKHK